MKYDIPIKGMNKDEKIRMIVINMDLNLQPNSISDSDYSSDGSIEISDIVQKDNTWISTIGKGEDINNNYQCSIDFTRIYETFEGIGMEIFENDQITFHYAEQAYLQK